MDADGIAREHKAAEGFQRAGINRLEVTSRHHIRSCSERSRKLSQAPSLAVSGWPIQQSDHIQVRVTHPRIASRDRTLQTQFAQAASAARHHTDPGGLDQQQESGVDTLVCAVIVDEYLVHAA